ncbi:hypothetical protein ACFQY3_09040 [Paenibacillus farraposensis]|uniref:hypothetical protein n=1 Tax=Paenibacillus farraposensis TaxID=2807095 RepID=UPI001E4F23EB|nr:hypothetical protein [Paenibacillus farraposensis]
MRKHDFYKPKWCKYPAAINENTFRRHKKFILFDISDPSHDRKMKVGLEYMISGLVGVICLWITDYENLGVEEIIEQLSEIHFNGVIDLFKNT